MNESDRTNPLNDPVAARCCAPGFHLQPPKITMKPITALFRKEFRQHGYFAVAMIGMCLLFQAAGYQWNYFSPTNISPKTYFVLALILTALYAGAAAALAYSTEHANNTFTFLRKLPISTTTLALGKTGWVVCGTLLVLFGNLFLAFLWTGGKWYGDLWFAFAFGVVEALVWGLFWSTRCRNQVEALLAGYFCAAVTLGILGNVLQPNNPDVVGVYIAIMPFRAAVTAIVGLFAVWGMMRWFDYETHRPLIARIFPEKMTFRYPKSVQTPFLALVHQHLRHASIFYPFGVLCCLTGTLIFLAVTVWFIFGIKPLWNEEPWWFPVFVIALLGGIAVFWATIFGHDQKNDSYRFLSRLGIHEGTVWWSRMLPAFLFYLPVLAAVFGLILVIALLDHIRWEAIEEMLPIFLVAGLAIPAVGSFISISIRSQMVSIALGFGVFFLLLGWGALILLWFGCSFWWTTLPMVFALLLASRIRAGYWLRETFTWRSRLIPLIPVFATVLAVFITIPLVRVYSIPYVSWEEVERYFMQTEIGEQLPPEERLALFRYVVEHREFPPDSPAAQKKDWFPYEGEGAETVEEAAQLRLQFIKERVNKYYNLDEWILAEYIASYRYHTVSGLKKLGIKNHVDARALWLMAVARQIFYWETVRLERLWRTVMVTQLVESGGLEDKNAAVFRNWYVYDTRNRRISFVAFDETVTSWYSSEWRNFTCDLRCSLVFAAINCYYWEHDQTLPETLDVLVGTYLDALPTDPVTGKMAELYLNSPKPEDVHRHVRLAVLGPSSFIRGAEPTDRDQERALRERLDKDFPRNYVGTYLRVGDSVMVIVEPEDVEP